MYRENEYIKQRWEYRDGAIYNKPFDGMSPQFSARVGMKVSGVINADGRRIIYQRTPNSERHGSGSRFGIYYARAVYTLVWGDIPDGLVIDHIDRNRLNDHPLNLRAITHTENLRSREKTTGDLPQEPNISYVKARDKYSVTFRWSDFRYHKYFPTLDLAIKARDEQRAIRGIPFHS